MWYFLKHMNDIEEVKSRVDIVDLVGHYVSLKKAGANFKGLCPFHHERTPSFMVNPERQIFKCFGCNKGGDIFTFIQEIENVEFGDALKMLADRAGVTLTPLRQPKPGEAPSEKSRYYAINALASQVFHKILLEHPSGKEALSYLEGRKITHETIKKWRIGYAPRKKVLREVLLKRGYSTLEIERAGKPDMFYDRIMFPILDVMGNIVGFTGRILHQGEPKYLNTPETPLFRKGRILFGLEKAKQAIKTKRQVIICEGQMDVISAHQAGTEHAVATSGTALTVDHLRILARYDTTIVFAFDADTAGETATKKAIDLAVTDGLSVKIIPIIKPYKDIGDITEKDPVLWRQLAEKPIPAVEWYLQTIFAKYTNGSLERKLSVDEKKQIAKELIPIIRRIPDMIEQAHYIQILAKRLGVKEETIQRALNKRPAEKQNQMSTSISQARHPLTIEEALLGLLERSKETQTLYENLYKSLRSWYNKPISDLLFAIENQYKGLSPVEVKSEIELLVKRYKEQEKDRLKADFAEKISHAEESGDRAAVKQLLADFQVMMKQSDQL